MAVNTSRDPQAKFTTTVQNKQQEKTAPDNIKTSTHPRLRIAAHPADGSNYPTWPALCYNRSPPPETAHWFPVMQTIDSVLWPGTDQTAVATTSTSPAWRTRLKAHQAALGILALHLLLGVLYSTITPAWEAHDEWAHFKYVEYVAQQRQLPPAGVRLTTEYTFDEATQPPLYYLLAALAILPIDTDDQIRPLVNPFATTGTGQGGVNMAVHDPLVEGWPWRGTILALHVARLVSVFIGTLALAATYAIARLLTPPGSASPQAVRLIPLLALSIHAFSPQWLFISSVVTNDALIGALGGAALYFALRLVLRPLTVAAVIGLAASVGLALLTKYTALAFLPVALLALIGAGIRELRRRRASGWQIAGALAAFLLTLVALAGWYFVRNWQLYGRLASRDPHSEASFWSRLAEPTTLLQGLAWDKTPGMLVYGFRTFWASFGWGNVEAASWVYWLWAGLCLAGLVGFLAWLGSNPGRGRRWAGILLLVQIGFSVALPMYRELLHGQEFLRGRYLLPILPAVSVVVALGVLIWLRPRWQINAARGLIVSMLALAVITPLAWIAPVYARPAPSAADVAPLPHPLHVRFGETTRGGDLVEITAYDLWPRGLSQAEAEVAPGRGLAVTIDWNVLRRADVNYAVSVALVGRNGEVLDQVHRYPAGGRLATTTWRPGDRWRETFWLEPREQPAPALGQISLSLWTPSGPDGTVAYLPALAADGTLLGDALRFGRVRLGLAEQPAPPAQPLAIVLGEPPLIGLAGYTVAGNLTPGATLTVTTTWQALAPGQVDLAQFIQVLDSRGHRVAGVDGPPDVDYPTGLWLSGDQVTARASLTLPADLPPDDYRLVVGLYDPTAGQRLPAFAAGQRLADDAIPF